MSLIPSSQRGWAEPDGTGSEAYRTMSGQVDRLAVPSRHRAGVRRRQPARPLTDRFRDGVLRRVAGWLAIFALLLHTAIPLGQAIPIGDDALARALIICTGNDAGGTSEPGDGTVPAGAKGPVCPVCLVHAAALALPAIAAQLDAPQDLRHAAWPGAAIAAAAPQRRHERPLVRGPPQLV